MTDKERSELRRLQDRFLKVYGKQLENYAERFGENHPVFADFPYTVSDIRNFAIPSLKGKIQQCLKERS